MRWKKMEVKKPPLNREVLYWSEGLASPRIGFLTKIGFFYGNQGSGTLGRMPEFWTELPLPPLNADTPHKRSEDEKSSDRRENSRGSCGYQS